MAAGSTYSQIATQTLGSATASVTFSSIPQTYTNLRLVISARSAASTFTAPAFQFNSDTATNYSWTGMFGDGGSAVSYRESNVTLISGEQIPRSGDAANMFGIITLDVFNYINTTTFKTVLVTNRNLGTGGIAYAGVGLWRATPAAINTITVVSGQNMAIGSTFTLYGIRGA
jgi:hypothetical protein